MKALLLTLLHLAVMTARLCGPGGVRAVIAEHFLLKQPLIVVHPYAVVRRTRRRGDCSGSKVLKFRIISSDKSADLGASSRCCCRTARR